MNEKLNLIKPCECSCTICQKMCMRPCFGTPQDIKKIIEAGYEDRLCLDDWGGKETNEEQVKILAPAIKGHTGKKAPFNPGSKRGCTFFTKGRCELHNLGLKPTSGKLANCKENDEVEESIGGLVVSTWMNEEAQNLVKSWCEERKIDPDEDWDLAEMLTGALGIMKLKIERGF